MGDAAFGALIVGAAILGLLFQSLGRAQVAYEWLLDGVGAAVGGFVANEYLGAFSLWGPAWDGMHVLPALIGAICLGGVVALLARSSDRPAVD